MNDLINTVINKDVMQGMKMIPDESIDSVITSPPYYHLRDYGFDAQWGLESDFNIYLNKLFMLMDEIWRVLKPTGTVWVNLGDTYNSGISGFGKRGTTTPKQKSNTGTTSDAKEYRSIIPKKSLMLIPHRFAIGCIDRGWIMRNDIIWAKSNGMPESVRDRFSKKHEYMFFMAKQQKYYFDLDAIRDQHQKQSIERQKRATSFSKKWINESVQYNTKIPKENAQLFGSPRARYHRDLPEGKNLRSPLEALDQGQGLNAKGKNPSDVSDYWDIPTAANSAKHYAAYNFRLIDKPIIAGSPEGGIVLDPFAGTGTTIIRAMQLNRSGIGIDGNPEYCAIANHAIYNELHQYQFDWT